jgi:hypothetical protein
MMKYTTKKTRGGFSAMSGRAAGRFFSALAIFALVLALGACETGADTGDEDGGSLITVAIAYSGGDDPWFYSLPKGNEETYTEVSGPAIKSGAWDLAVEAHDNSFFIRTNSGASADEYDTRGSGGGQGGVWFTDKTDFGAVRVSDRVIPGAGSEYAPYTEDITRYAIIMNNLSVKEVLNVITYLGYPGSGSGLSAEDPFQRNEADSGNMASFIPYSFNKKGAYTMLGMPPAYTPTDQVYIVRHGDGDGWSKIQLVDAYIERTKVVLKIKCAPAAD